MKIFTINPGSTSTKIALFEDEEKIFAANVSHDAAHLAAFRNLSEQLDYRMGTIERLLEENKVDLQGLDACVGRGGGLIAMEGGIVVVKDGRVLASMPLPIAGLMTTESAEWVAERLGAIHGKARTELGVNPDMEPIMLLTFMALPVIPALKLTTRGLFDSELFDFVPLEA